jgi:hypothetical protein
MKIAKLLAVSLLLATATFSKARAQGTNSYRTNVSVLVNVTFNLTLYQQDYLFGSTNGFNGPYAPSAKTSKIATSDVIGAIAHQAHITGDMSNAKLYYRRSWIDPTNVSSDMILRNPEGDIMGTNDAVINSYLSLTFPDTVTSSRANLNGTTNATDYANLNAILSTSRGSFNLHGIATKLSGSLFYNGKVIDQSPNPKSFTSTVAGSGSVGFHQAEWKGTVTGSGQKVEVTEVAP